MMRCSTEELRLAGGMGVIWAGGAMTGDGDVSGDPLCASDLLGSSLDGRTALSASRERLCIRGMVGEGEITTHYHYHALAAMITEI